MDVDSIEPGLDFLRVLENQVAECDVFLAVIGPRWLEAQDETGKRAGGIPTRRKFLVGAGVVAVVAGLIAGATMIGLDRVLIYLQDSSLRTFGDHLGSVYSVAFAPDGHTALSGAQDKTLKLWDVATGKLLRPFEGHSDFVYSVAFAPDGRTVLSGSWDRTLKLWDVDR
jgi:WD40 repeat protein